MSIEAISAVLSHSKAKGTVKLVLMGIAWHTGEDYERGAYPSQKTLAAYANCSERQVRRSLVELHEAGEIEMLHHGGAGFNAERRSNRYWIRIDCPEECDNTLQHRTSTTQHRTSTTQHRTLTAATPDIGVLINLRETKRNLRNN